MEEALGIDRGHRGRLRLGKGKWRKICCSSQQWMKEKQLQKIKHTKELFQEEHQERLLNVDTQIMRDAFCSKKGSTSRILDRRS